MDGYNYNNGNAWDFGSSESRSLKGQNRQSHGARHLMMTMMMMIMMVVLMTMMLLMIMMMMVVLMTMMMLMVMVLMTVMMLMMIIMMCLFVISSYPHHLNQENGGDLMRSISAESHTQPSLNSRQKRLGHKRMDTSSHLSSLLCIAEKSRRSSSFSRRINQKILKSLFRENEYARRMGLHS